VFTFRRLGGLAMAVLLALVGVVVIPLAPEAPSALKAPAVEAAANAILPGFDSTSYGANDDGSYPCTGSGGGVPAGCTPSPVNLPFSADFFGTTYSSVYINTNGNLTFGAPLSAYTPYPLNQNAVPIIAPFFADIDTRVGNGMTFGNGTVDGHTAFGVSWPGVGCYNQNSAVLNYFQAILIDRSDTGAGNIDVEFNYNQIQWDSGQASNGDNNCLNGTAGRVGYAAGLVDPATYYELPGSGVDGALLDSSATSGLIHSAIGNTQPGRYIFPFRNGRPPVDTPAVLGSAWYGGHGVNVCYPAGSRSSEFCGSGPFSLHVGDAGSPWGYWQCVELAQRFYNSQGWWGGFFPVGTAKEIAKTYYSGSTSGTAGWFGGQNPPANLVWHQAAIPRLSITGDGYVPGPGDLIVTDGSTSADAGHVAVVNNADLNGDGSHTIYVVEQNKSSTGWAEYTINASGAITRAGYINNAGQIVSDDTRDVLGSVHVGASSTTATPILGGSVHLPAGIQLTLSSNQAAASGTLSLSELPASDLPPLPSGGLLESNGVGITLPTLTAGGSAELTFPYDPSSVPSGYSLSVFRDGTWTQLPTTLTSTTATAEVTDSTGYALIATPTPNTYHPLTPTRVLDTRNGTGGLSGPFTNHVARTFTVVGGSSGVPSNATAVTGNLTVTGQTNSGYLFIGPTAMNNPGSSTLNFPVGDDRANAVTVALGAGGTLSITFVAPSNGPTAQAIFDVTGYFTPDASGATYHALSPTRVLDTRNGTGGLSGPFTNHGARTFTLAGVPAGATAVTGNLTVTGQTSGGYLFIGPVATNDPGSSTLNFPVGDDRANAVTVALGSEGTLSITFVAPGNGPSAQAIFDVTGYFTPDMSGAVYVPLDPTRLLDTRNGTGGLSGPFTNHAARTFTLSGGSSSVPSSVTAVTGNLTVTGQTSNGYLFIGPVATNNPVSSTLNFPVGDDRANAVTVGLGGGSLSITFVAPSNGPTAHAIFDVTGYFVQALG
jgi:hypothetical protein